MWVSFKAKNGATCKEGWLLNNYEESSPPERTYSFRVSDLRCFVIIPIPRVLGKAFRVSTSCGKILFVSRGTYDGLLEACVEHEHRRPSGIIRID